MKRFLFVLLTLIVSVHGAENIETWFKEGTVKGNIKYYFIETKKDIPGKPSTSAHANSIGGSLNYTTGSLNGFQMGATFMTTNGFALPNVVDTSVLGRDNGVRFNGTPEQKAEIAKKSFSVLGEAFIKYNYKGLSAVYGRQVIKTSLIHAKDVRMIPSAVQGAFVNYKMEYGTGLGAAYLTHFKQRTSDHFTNIVKHALGDKTKAITGDDEGKVLLIDGVYKTDKTEVKLYNYYADNFINSFYADAGFKNKFGSGWSYNAGVQYINQMSVGNADDNLANDTTLAGGKIASNAFGFKLGMGYRESKLGLAFTKVLSDSGKHDSLVLPWDGTPLFSNMITSNDLFQSNYGKTLNADSIYIGGSAGIKLAYTQKYDFTGVKGLKTVVSYLNVDNSKFDNKQRDYNAVLAYGIRDFTLALKGIWVRHNSSANAQGTVSQIDKLTQYRVIANYTF